MGTPTGDGETVGAASTGPGAGAGPEPSGSAPELPIGARMILRRSWRTFAAAWPECLIVHWGATTMSWLVLFVLATTLGVLGVLAGDREVLPLLEFLSFLGLFVVPAWIFWLGRNLALLKVARRQPVALETLFQCGPQVLTFLLAAAVVASPCLIVYGTAEALLAYRGDGSLVALIRLLLTRLPDAANTPALPPEYDNQMVVLLGAMGLGYAALFAIMVRLGQFPYLIIDRGEDVSGSLLGSLELTRGRVATVFVVYLAQVMLNVAGLLVCFVGLFITLPLNGLISAVTYQVLSRDLPAIEVPEPA